MVGIVCRLPGPVDRLVLVNPASSFDRSAWPTIGPLLPDLPEELYNGVPYALVRRCRLVDPVLPPSCPQLKAGI